MVRTPATVTVRVTASPGAEWGHGRRAATTGAKAGQESEVEAEQQSGKVKGDGQHCMPGGDPLLGWEHG